MNECDTIGMRHEHLCLLRGWRIVLTYLLCKEKPLFIVYQYHKKELCVLNTALKTDKQSFMHHFVFILTWFDKINKPFIGLVLKN